MRYLPASIGLLAWMTSVAVAQGYPEKPVTMIAPFPAGGSVDLIARAVAQHMSDLWKQPVLVADRPGAGGNIGAEAVARAPGDGYTLLMGTTALARARPGMLNSASADVGSSNHLALVLFNTLTGAGSSPEELAKFLRDEMVKWGKVVKAAGITPE